MRNSGLLLPSLRTDHPRSIGAPYNRHVPVHYAKTLAPAIAVSFGLTMILKFVREEETGRNAYVWQSLVAILLHRVLAYCYPTPPKSTESITLAATRSICTLHMPLVVQSVRLHIYMLDGLPCPQEPSSRTGCIYGTPSEDLAIHWGRLLGKPSTVIGR